MKSAVIYIALLSALLAACPGIPDEPVTQEPAPQQPEPPPNWQVGIVAVGDTGTGDAMQYRVAKGIEDFCKVNRCDTGLLLGDNIYEIGVKTDKDPLFQSKFEKPYANLKFPFHPALGNHDAVQCWKCQISYRSERWVMYGEYYSFGKGGVDFYALHTNSFAKNQSAWLKTALSSSEGSWRIVYGHHPIRSGGSHGDSKTLIKDLLPILQDNGGVDFYISGHDHDLQLIERDGMRYIVSGAGAKLRNTSSGKGTVFAKSSYGFVHLLISAKDARVSFVDHSGQVLFMRHYKK